VSGVRVPPPLPSPETQLFASRGFLRVFLIGKSRALGILQRCNRCIRESPPVTDSATARQAAGSACGGPAPGDRADHASADGAANLPKEKPMGSSSSVRLVAASFQRLRCMKAKPFEHGDRFRNASKPGGAWRGFHATARRCLGKCGALLVASLTAVPVMASTLHDGAYVREGRSCEASEPGDQLISNGHSVSPPGQSCRVASRTSAGSYYPIFNQRCTSGTGDYELEVRVNSSNRIWISRSGRPAVAYRHCRAKGPLAQKR
jgi:hypothetical protein